MCHIRIVVCADLSELVWGVLLTQKILKIYILYPRAWKSVFLDEINDDIYISKQGTCNLFEGIWLVGCFYMYVLIHDCEFLSRYTNNDI